MLQGIHLFVLDGRDITPDFECSVEINKQYSWSVKLGNIMNMK